MSSHKSNSTTTTNVVTTTAELDEDSINNHGDEEGSEIEVPLFSEGEYEEASGNGLLVTPPPITAARRSPNPPQVLPLHLSSFSTIFLGHMYFGVSFDGLYIFEGAEL